MSTPSSRKGKKDRNALYGDYKAAAARLTKEERWKIAREYRAAVETGAIGAGVEVAKKYKLHPAYVRGWADTREFKAAEAANQVAPPPPPSKKDLFKPRPEPEPGRPEGKGGWHPRHSQETRDKAIALFKEGKKGAEIAALLGMKPSSVWSLVARAGLTAGSKRKVDLVAAGNRALAKMNGNGHSDPVLSKRALKRLSPEGMIRAFLEYSFGRGVQIESIQMEGSKCTYRIVGSFEL